MEQANVQELPRAITTEAFKPEGVNLIGQDPGPGVDATVSLRFLVGQVGQPGRQPLYLKAVLAELEPATAVELGEAIAAEGRRLTSGLLQARPGTHNLPMDLTKRD